MTPLIFIDGAAGTTGLEIEARLSARTDIELLRLNDNDRKQLAARRAAINSADLVILCLPDKAAREAVALIDNPHTRVIDASSAHRIALGWVYGFPEIVGHAKIANARFVSNPGCYATGFIALIAPLIANGVIPANWPITAHAISGYSGGGKEMIAAYADPKSAPAWQTYALNLSHKHLAEMQHQSGLALTPIFSPAVVNAYQGMSVEVPLHLSGINGLRSAEQIITHMAKFYAEGNLITVSESHDLPTLNFSAVVGRDLLKIYILTNQSGDQVRLIAHLDNLGKGAAGAAVQNLNIMLGFSETAGLRL